MERVLVTGATGFVGQALCHSLLKTGHHVRASYVEDREPDLFAGQVEWVKTAGLGPETEWARALSGVTRVVHLAALAHAAAERATEQELLRVNAVGTQRLCEAVTATGSVARFVLMSSVAAIVHTDVGVVDDEAPAAPGTPYGRSKLAAENAVRSTLNGTASDYVIIRPTLVYGAGNPGNMRRLQRLVARGVPLPLASLENKRTFCFLDNLISALTTVLTHPNASNQAFVVCDNETVSTPDLVRMIAECGERTPRLIPCPAWLLARTAKIGDLVETIFGRQLPFDSDTWIRLSGSLIGSNARLRTACEWAPPYSLQEGLRKTIGIGES